jgi:uncharacterized protein involved in exopolysaccharide biosynthesis/Mrp family chromosome partitioning ATPase
MTVPNQNRVAAMSGIKVADIYDALFRHKWIIIGSWGIGLAAAAVLYLTTGKVYRSEAKLLVRYIRESRSVDALGADGQITSTAKGDTVINSELEILSSMDLARQVADSVGPAKIIGGDGGGSNSFLAASIINKGLRIEVPRRSSIIKVSVDHADPETAQSVCRALVAAYLRKHIEIHRNLGAIDEVLDQQVSDSRLRLAQAEDVLRKERARIGSISVEEAKLANADQMRRIRQEMLAAEAELGELGVFLTNEVRSAQADGALLVTNQTPQAGATNLAAKPEAEAAPVASPSPSHEKVDRYRAVCAELASFRSKELELQLRYTEENPVIQQLRQQVANLEKVKGQLEAENPDLALLAMPAAPAVQGKATGVSEGFRRAALLSRIRVLSGQLDNLRAEAAAIDGAESAIRTAQRNRDSAETTYKNLLGSLERARFDQALDPGKTPNISKVQEPSPAFPVSSGRTKAAAAALAVGFVGGIALALLIGLFLDQTVKKAVDLEAHMQLPHCLTIPDFARNGHSRQPKGRPPPVTVVADAAVPPARAAGEAGDAGQAMRSYCDALRDHLMLDFHARNLTHKPKLVGVTGCGKSSGVTTVAAGLAQSLSETGDGSVLLVELNLEQGLALSHFCHGKPGFTLSEMMDEAVLNNAADHKDLYLVSPGKNNGASSMVVYQKLAELMPRLKVSQLDYVVFDMPPVSLMTPTAKLAGMLDTTLLVVASGETQRAAVTRALSLLRESEATVMPILNKSHSYLPRWLENRVQS